jgi:DNA-binding response OmpR family regulator
MAKILIVEDELMIADMVEGVLVDNGYEVCGIARTVAEAIALGRLHRPDLAIVDVRLADDGLGTDVARQLRHLFKIGILYSTANTSYVLLSATDGEACLAKPYRWADLLRSLEIVADVAAGGRASPPFPRGFQMLPSNVDAGRELTHG